MTKRKAYNVTYQIVTATRDYRCVFCLGDIPEGERYWRRRRRHASRGYVTISKCSDCLAMPEGEL